MKLNFSIAPLLVVIFFALLLHIINNSMNDAQEQQRSVIPAVKEIKHIDFNTPMTGTHQLPDSLPL
jgi:Cu/Ag efflux protein CusF